MNLKNKEEITAMREGGRMLAEIVESLRSEIHPGVTAKELDAIAEKRMVAMDVQPSFKGYRGFPGVTCISINEEVVHGIPGGRVLEEGDIITIDCGIIHKGLHTDHAVTFFVGKVAPETQKFVETVKRALNLGIAQVKPGRHIGDISAVVQKTVEGAGYSIARDYIGHGIGYQLHELPEVPNFGKRGMGPALVPGLTIAIEPICIMGERYTKTADDNWTVLSRDGSLAAQFEHTILVTNSGSEILTKLT